MRTQGLPCSFFLGLSWFFGRDFDIKAQKRTAWEGLGSLRLIMNEPPVRAETTRDHLVVTWVLPYLTCAARVTQSLNCEGSGTLPPPAMN